MKVNYTGWLTDGTVFDSSEKQRRLGSSLKLASVVPGWQIGIPGMKPGGIRKLVISPDKGYGNQAKGKIPPGSTLIFEVELLGVSTPPAPATGPELADVRRHRNGGTDDPDLKDIGRRAEVPRHQGRRRGEPVQAGRACHASTTPGGWSDGNVVRHQQEAGRQAGGRSHWRS